jgi:hypothetical protein
LHCRGSFILFIIGILVIQVRWGGLSFLISLSFLWGLSLEASIILIHIIFTSILILWLFRLLLIVFLRRSRLRYLWSLLLPDLILIEV